MEHYLGVAREEGVADDEIGAGLGLRLTSELLDAARADGIGSRAYGG